MTTAALSEAELTHYLSDVRELVVEEIQRWIPRHTSYRKELYDIVLDYPLRQAKALRPTLAIATCRAWGGTLEGVLPSAAAIELYHNAFLVHDDVEDGSELRRGQPTLQRTHGVPIAVNVGDAMLALALAPLLENTRYLGLGKALAVLREISEMAQHSAEGQALELYWLRSRRTDLGDDDYLAMVQKKTAHYSFVTPITIGALAAGAPEEERTALRRFALSLGTAFQIQDDLLNLRPSDAYGKEPAGDLWEGKYTLILLHALRSSTSKERERAAEILARGRPSTVTASLARALQDLQGALTALTDDLDAERCESIRENLRRCQTSLEETKRPSDVEFLRQLIEKHRSLDHARGIARQWADRAHSELQHVQSRLPESVHKNFLMTLVEFVVARSR